MVASFKLFNGKDPPVPNSPQNRNNINNGPKALNRAHTAMILGTFGVQAVLGVPMGIGLENFARTPGTSAELETGFAGLKLAYPLLPCLGGVPSLRAGGP